MSKLTSIIGYNMLRKACVKAKNALSKTVLCVSRPKIPLVLEIMLNRVKDIEIAIQLNQNMNFQYLYNFNSFIYPLIYSTILGKHQISRLMLPYSDPNYLLRHQYIFNDPLFRIVSKSYKDETLNGKAMQGKIPSGFLLTPTTISFIKGDTIHLEMYLRAGGQVHPLYAFDSLVQYFFRHPEIFRRDICEIMTRYNQFPKNYGESITMSRNFELLYITLKNPGRLSTSYPRGKNGVTPKEGDAEKQVFDDLEYDLEELRHIMKIFIDYGLSYLPTREGLFDNDLSFHQILFPDSPIKWGRAEEITPRFAPPKHNPYQTKDQATEYWQKNLKKFRMVIEDKDDDVGSSGSYIKEEETPGGDEIVEPVDIKKSRDMIFKALSIKVPQRKTNAADLRAYTSITDTTPIVEDIEEKKKSLIVVDPRGIRLLQSCSSPPTNVPVKKFLKWKRSKSQPLIREAIVRSVLEKMGGEQKGESSDSDDNADGKDFILTSESEEDIYSGGKMKVARSDLFDFLQEFESEGKKKPRQTV